MVDGQLIKEKNNANLCHRNSHFHNNEDQQIGAKGTGNLYRKNAFGRNKLGFCLSYLTSSG